MLLEGRLLVSNKVSLPVIEHEPACDKGFICLSKILFYCKFAHLITLSIAYEMCNTSQACLV